MNDPKDLLLVGIGTMGRPYLDAAARLGLRVRAVESAAVWENRPVDLAERFYRVAGGQDESWARGCPRPSPSGARTAWWPSPSPT